MPPSEDALEAFVSTVETWQTRRREEAQAFSLRGLRGFVELMNYQTRRLVNLTHKEDPDFWTALAELATQAATLTTEGAKLFADKRDMTNL